MISINTNLSSLIVQSNLKTSSSGLSKAIQRMTTGYKINGAKDNAAGFSISTKMSTKISALQQAEDNATMGLDMVQTASSALESMSDLTSRLRALATQAQNGTYGNNSLTALNAEAKAIVQEINRIKNTTQYNGINLISGENTATQSADAISTQSAKSASSTGFIEEVQRRDTSGMTSLASVDENIRLTSGAYSISTAEELAKLATMTNNGKIGSGIEFVLANDIDLSAYSNGEGWTPIGNDSYRFKATFDGNGCIIKNLYINRPSASKQGLFGRLDDSVNIYNIALENISVTGGNYTGGLIGEGHSGTIKNCYTTGTVTGEICSAGIIAQGSYQTITNCYSKAVVIGEDKTGGLVGYGRFGTINESYFAGTVTGGDYTGGLVGDGGNNINNSYSIGTVIGLSSFVGGIMGLTDRNRAKLTNVYFSDTTGQANGIGSGTARSGTADLVKMAELDELIKQGILPDYKPKPVVDSGATYGFQVGINSADSSQITLQLQAIDVSALDGLTMDSEDALSVIDEILKNFSEQQTNLGAVENRLTSALEEISTKYDNLVSSRSTLRDADVAEESSAYIRNQILQQASATLLATANQTPAIALQLI
mgnify:CR=1 FL=1